MYFGVFPEHLNRSMFFNFYQYFGLIEKSEMFYDCCEAKKKFELFLGNLPPIWKWREL